MKGGGQAFDREVFLFSWVLGFFWFWPHARSLGEGQEGGIFGPVHVLGVFGYGSRLWGRRREGVVSFFGGD